MISTCDLHLFAPSETILEFLEGSLVPAPSFALPFFNVYKYHNIPTTVT